MTLVWKRWRITTYDRGYQIQRRVNATRWKTEGYYTDFAQAVQSVFDQGVLNETTDYSIELGDPASARSCMLELVTKLEQIKAEILEALK